MSSPNSWFVQTGFGTILGPMPTDALFEMVRTGALIGSDLVRTEDSADWQSAASIPELFPNLPKLAPSSTASTTPPTTLPSREAHVEQQQPVSLTPTLPTSQRPTTPTETVAYAFDQPTTTQPAPTQPTPEIDLVAKWKAERQQRPKRRTAKALDEIDETQSLADQIDREVIETELEPIPDIFADEVSATENAPMPAGLSELHVTTTTARTEPRQTIKLPSLLSQITPDLPPLPKETFAQMRNRWLRSLPSKPIIAAVIVLAFSAWWFWPQSNRPVFNRLVAIWNELQTHRAHPLDKSGMANFVSRAEAELDILVPGLSQQAKSNSREATLLRVSRDCLQQILKRPRERDTVLEKQLDSHFQELAMCYGLVANDTPANEMEPDN